MRSASSLPPPDLKWSDHDVSVVPVAQKEETPVSRPPPGRNAKTAECNGLNCLKHCCSLGKWDVLTSCCAERTTPRLASLQGTIHSEVVNGFRKRFGVGLGSPCGQFADGSAGCQRASAGVWTWPAIVYPSAPGTVAGEADVRRITLPLALIPGACRTHKQRVLYGIMNCRPNPMFFGKTC